jgi:pimeloyl-ACP methyl ester carboxylesterase
LNEKRATTELQINGAVVRKAQSAYHPVRVMTNRGSLYFRHYKVAGGSCGAVWLAGVGGGWTSPARKVYTRLGLGLRRVGISSIQLSYRQPEQLEECVLDALAAIAYFRHEGVTKIALVGYGLGAAVAIQAAAATQQARTVIGIAAQSSGVRPISLLGPTCSALILHGTADRVLPSSCSEYVYSLAHEPKKLILFDKGDHSLDAVSGEVYRTIYAWLVKYLIADTALDGPVLGYNEIQQADAVQRG